MEVEILKDKVALVTGASRGIGKAIAIALLGAGVHVMATARSEMDLQRLAEDAANLEGHCDIARADLADSITAQDLVEETVARFGRLDILVNNAGELLSRSIAETTADDWDRVMAVNARAPFLLSREACERMKAAGGGTIIQIASVAGEKSYPNQAAYTASKHALVGFSKVLAREVQAHDIRVHVILPGGVDTAMVEQMDAVLTPSELMQPAEIAEIVMFLLTRRGNAVIDAVRIRRAVKDPWI